MVAAYAETDAPSISVVTIGRTHLGVMGGTLLEASRDAFGMLEQRAIEAISDLEERRVLRL